MQDFDVNSHEKPGLVLRPQTYINLHLLHWHTYSTFVFLSMPYLLYSYTMTSIWFFYFYKTQIVLWVCHHIPLLWNRVISTDIPTPIHPTLLPILLHWPSRHPMHLHSCLTSYPIICLVSPCILMFHWWASKHNTMLHLYIYASFLVSSLSYSKGE